MTKNFKPGTKITGNSLMGDLANPLEVTGEYLRHFGTTGSALLIEDAIGTRYVIDGATARHAEPTQAMIYRALADHLDAFPELDNIGSAGALFGKLRIQVYAQPGESDIAVILPWLRSVGAVNVAASRTDTSWHLAGKGRTTDGLPIEIVAISDDDEAAALDEAIGDSKLNGAIPLEVIARHQRPHPTALFTPDQVAELEHWAKTPLLPAESGSDGAE